MAHLKDLERSGLSTSNTVREVLTQSEDPAEALRRFQEENEIQLSSLKPITKLLDLHGVRRATCHELANTELTEKILAKLRALGQKRTPEAIRKLEQQLERSFKLYHVPRLQPIVLETLKQLPRVADRYLKLILCDREIYANCAVEVRQQIWLKNDSRFLEAINPVLDSYFEQKEQLLILVDRSPTNFFTRDTTKARRTWPQVQALINMVGVREPLYNRLMEVIRERFAQTGNSHYCSLRLEVLMAAHDHNVEFVAPIDPCHEFAWCLDACVRDRHLDAQQSAKLKMLLDPARKAGQPRIDGELAMIAADPHVVHFLCCMAIKLLKDNASAALYLPRELLPLQLIIRLLEMGTGARVAVAEGGVAVDVGSSTDTFTRFLPLMVRMLSEDVIRAELQRAPEEVGEKLMPGESPPDQAMGDLLLSSTVHSLLWFHYVLDLLPSKKRINSHSTLLRYAQMLPELAGDLAAQGTWGHLLVHRLLQTHSIDPLMANPLLGSLIVEEVLIGEGNEEELEEPLPPHAKFHLLRLLVQLHGSMPEPLLKKAREVLIKKRDVLVHKATEKAAEGEDGELPSLDPSSFMDAQFIRMVKEHEAILLPLGAAVGDGLIEGSVA